MPDDKSDRSDKLRPNLKYPLTPPPYLIDQVAPHSDQVKFHLVEEAIDH